MMILYEMINNLIKDYPDIVIYIPGSIYLYIIDDDPCEMINNLIKDYPDIVVQIFERLAD